MKRIVPAMPATMINPARSSVVPANPATLYAIMISPVLSREVPRPVAAPRATMTSPALTRAVPINPVPLPATMIAVAPMPVARNLPVHLRDITISPVLTKARNAEMAEVCYLLSCFVSL